MRRVSVVGSSGSDKTALARRIADALEAHISNWTGSITSRGGHRCPVDESRRIVSELVSRETWVVDGNCSTVSDLVWDEADTVVWLDLSRTVVSGRIVRRTLGRLRRHEELWNGSWESWLNLIEPRPERNIILWSLTRQSQYRRRYEGLSQDGTWSHLDVVRLRNRGEESAFVAGLGRHFGQHLPRPFSTKARARSMSSLSELR